MNLDIISRRLLRTKDVCQLLGIKKSKLYQMIADGEFPEPLKNGRMNVWPSEDVSRWLDAFQHRANANRRRSQVEAVL